MAGKKKNLGSLFDLGFPLHSRVGQRAADQHLDRFGESLGLRAGKALHYLNSELGEVGQSYIDRAGQVMAEPMDTLNRVQGSTDVRHVAVRANADFQLANIEQRTQARTGLYTTAPIPGMNGSIKPVRPIGETMIVPRPPGLMPEFPPQPIPAPIPCPRCGFVVFLFQCPAPVINLSCPECNCNATCSVDVTYIATIVVRVINNLVARTNVNLALDQTIIQQVVNQTINELPPPSPPTPIAAPAEQLGRDCGHAIHVCLCGPPTDPTCLGSDKDHPLFIAQVVPAPRPALCLPPP